MLREQVTIVVPSAKRQCYTAQLNPWMRGYNVIVHRNHDGMAKAFNDAVGMADTPTIVLMSDDLKVDATIQRFFNVKQGEFCMIDTGAFPGNGVHVFRQDDFWRVGGFNQTYKHGSLDSEWYARAVLKGLRYKPIPPRLVKHVKHPSRASTIYKLFNVLTDRANFVISYFRHYPKEVLKHGYLHRLMRGQFRMVLLNFLFLIKTIINNKLTQWWNIMGEEYC